MGHSRHKWCAMVDILYSDEALLAVDKPTGLLTVPGRGADKQDCLLQRVLAEAPNALLVHRLDMDTSGVMIFARTSEAQRSLGQQFERRETIKRYLAIVEGVLAEDSGRIEFSLRKDMTVRLPPRHLVDCVRGKRAITEWTVLERSDATTRLALYPLTGRSHQLRVHLQSIGHPIIGDPIYGTPSKRLMLHAERLEVQHPTSGERLVLVAPVSF